MATPLELLDLVICQAEEAAAAGKDDAPTLERAAEIVEDFAAERGLAALDAVLEAAARDELIDTAALRRSADEATQQTELLQAEIRRFLSLDHPQ